MSFEERIADLPALPTPIWPPGREPLTTFRATFSMLELLHARIRALEAIPEVGFALSASIQRVAGASMHLMDAPVHCLLRCQLPIVHACVSTVTLPCQKGRQSFARVHAWLGA